MNRPAPGPALWRAERDGNAVFLFGTIHVAADGAPWRTPLLDTVIDGANAVLLERGQFARSRPDVMAATLWAQFRPSVRLLEVLPEPQQAKFTLLCRELNLDPLSLGMLSPVVAGSILATLIAERAGRSQAQSADNALFNASKGRRLPIESASVWQGVFARDVQTAMARDSRVMSLDDIGTQIARLELLDDAYLRGDLAVIGEQGLIGTGPFFDAFLVRRNKVWADRVEQLASRGQKVLAAGGLAHFVGRDGVCGLLADRGFAVSLEQGIPSPSIWPL